MSSQTDRVRSASMRDVAEVAGLAQHPARALRFGEFRSIAVVSFDADSLRNVRTITAIANEAARRNYAIELIQIQSTGGPPRAADSSGIPCGMLRVQGSPTRRRPDRGSQISD